MNKIDLCIARDRAEQEIHDEDFKAAVAREKARLRANEGKSFWQRLIAKLPFTITWKTP